MGKIVMKHLQLKQGEIPAFADLIYRKVFENPTYGKLQPLAIALKPLSAGFASALLDAEEGGKDRTKIKDLAKDALNSHLTKMGMTIELESNGNDDYITGTGFPIRTPSAKKVVNYIETPKDFTVRNDDKRKGVLNFSWKKDDNATNNVIEEFMGNDVWKRVTSSTSISAQLTDLPLNSTHIYRMYTLGSGSLVSDFSNSVTITVNP